MKGSKGRVGLNTLEQGRSRGHKWLQASVFAPITFLACVGFSSRTHSSHFQFEAYNQAQNNQVSAYAPLVKEVRDEIPYALDPTAKAVRSIANEWVSGTESGRLARLQPLFVDDTVDAGVKSEIYNANGQLVAALENVAEKERMSGQWSQSAADSLLAAKTGSCVRGFDLSGMARENQYLLRSIAIVRKDMPHLSAAQTQDMARALPVICLENDQVTDLALRERNLYVQRTMNRNAKEAERFTKEITTQDLSNLQFLNKRGEVRKLAMKSGSEDELILVSNVAFAYESVNNVNTQVRSLMSAMKA